MRRGAAGLNKKNNQLNNQPVPKKNEIKNKSNNRNATGVVLQHQSAYQYQGPIPPPEMMEKYKNIYADAPKIILQEFKENSEHIILGASDRKSTRLNSSHSQQYRMQSSA